MRALLMGALAVAAGVALAQVACLLLFHHSLPLWAAITVPFVAGLATLMVSGRRRALRRQRARRLRPAARAARVGAAGRELG